MEGSAGGVDSALVAYHARRVGSSDAAGSARGGASSAWRTTWPGRSTLPTGIDGWPFPQASGDLGGYGGYLKEKAAAGAGGKRPAWAVTEDNILGPFHREGAPFRGKVTPPLEPGNVMVISGRVFGHDTRKPLPNTVVDVWQANAEGRYDNDDPKRPPAARISGRASACSCWGGRRSRCNGSY